jgi:hypothetical protein
VKRASHRSSTLVGLRFFACEATKRCAMKLLLTEFMQAKFQYMARLCA